MLRIPFYDVFFGRFCSGNVEGVQTISQLVNHLQPKIDREKQAEQNDVTFVIGETLDHMSRIPQQMQGKQIYICISIIKCVCMYLIVYVRNI